MLELRNLDGFYAVGRRGKPANDSKKVGQVNKLWRPGFGNNWGGGDFVDKCYNGQLSPSTTLLDGYSCFSRSIPCALTIAFARFQTDTAQSPSNRSQEQNTPKVTEPGNIMFIIAFPMSSACSSLGKCPLASSLILSPYMTASAIWRSTCERTCSSIGAETSVNRETIRSCVLFTTCDALAPLNALISATRTDGHFLLVDATAI